MIDAKHVEVATACLLACSAAVAGILPEWSPYLLTMETAFLICLSLGPPEWLEKATSKADVTQAETTSSSVSESELSAEEREAVAASKRIVANAREKFLKENGGFVPMASANAQQLMSTAAATFAKNLNPSVSAEGKPWVLQYENSARELKIYAADYPGHSVKRWKVETVLKTNMEAAYDAMFVPEKRRKWDLLIRDIRMLEINDCEPHVGDGLAITSVYTNAFLMVSSRSMLDLALQRCQPKGGIHIINVTCPSHFEEAKKDPGLADSVRATTHIGSGAAIEPIPGRPGYIKYTLVSTLDLGGWLMQSVINGTMSSALAQSTEQMQDFFKKE